jgi:hypothetical protein
MVLSVRARVCVCVSVSVSCRVPDELRRHSLSDGEGGHYSTNLDRNRYGNDDQYLSTVIRYDLEFLSLCPCMVDVEIIDAKNGQGSILVSADPEMCICGPEGKKVRQKGAAARRRASQTPQALCASKPYSTRAGGVGVRVLRVAAAPPCLQVGAVCLGGTLSWWHCGAGVRRCGASHVRQLGLGGCGDTGSWGGCPDRQTELSGLFWCAGPGAGGGAAVGRPGRGVPRGPRGPGVGRRRRQGRRQPRRRRRRAVGAR